MNPFFQVCRVIFCYCTIMFSSLLETLLLFYPPVNILRDTEHNVCVCVCVCVCVHLLLTSFRLKMPVDSLWHDRVMTGE
jgi:hypothetical protein